MAKKSLEQCRRRRDFVAYARRNGAEIVNGGRHVCIRYNGCRVAVPQGEIRPGTRRAIVRSLIALGLGVLLAVVMAAL